MIMYDLTRSLLQSVADKDRNICSSPSLRTYSVGKFVFRESSKDKFPYWIRQEVR